MTCRTRSLLLAGTVWLAGWPPAWAQLPVPRLDTVFPLGVQRGGSVTVTVSGVNLEGSGGLYFSRPGISAKHKEGLSFDVAAARDVAPGPVDVRVLGTWGISNPRTFVIGTLVERVEKEPNDRPGDAQELPLESVVNGRIDGKADADRYAVILAADQQVVIQCFAQRIDSMLRAVVSVTDPDGRLLTMERQGFDRDTDFAFRAARAGRHEIRVHDLEFGGGPDRFYRLAVHTQPTLAAAYPPIVGSGGPTPVELYGFHLATGRPAAPATSPARPETGTGTPSRISAERGSRNIGAPVPVSGLDVLPMSIAMPSADVDLQRPAADLFLMKPAWLVDGFSFRLDGPAGPTNPILLGLAEEPIVLEREPNDSLAQAQPVSIPADLVGRCMPARDRDVFRFRAQKGQVLAIEGISERMGFPVDLHLVLERLVDASGDSGPTRQFIGEYDDTVSNVGRNKFNQSMHEAETVLKVPEDGEYLLTVRDGLGTSRGDERSVYRVRVGAPRPDFRLAVVPIDEGNPSSVVVRRGGTAAAHVFAYRRNGFSDPIQVEAADLPPGLMAAPATIAGGASETTLVFHAKTEAPDFAGAVIVRGTAQVEGRRLTRTAQSGTVLVAGGNPKAPLPARLERSFCLSISGNAPYRLEAVPSQTTFGQGSILSVSLALHRLWPDFSGPLANVTAVGLPTNVDNQQVTIDTKQSAAALNLLFKNNVAPGTYSFVVAGTGQVPFNKDPKGKKANVAVSDPSLPITVTVLPRPADLSVTPANPTLKAGGTVEVKVGVKRVAGFDGSVELDLFLPAGVTGLSCEPVTVPGAAKEGSLRIRAAPDITAGLKQFVAVRGRMTHSDRSVTVDARLDVNVTR